MNGYRHVQPALWTFTCAVPTRNPYLGGNLCVCVCVCALLTGCAAAPLGAAAAAARCGAVCHVTVSVLL